MAVTKIGIQNPVMSFPDPFQVDNYGKYNRGGENIFEDREPSLEEYVEILKFLGVEFLMNHVVPERESIEKMLDLLEKQGFSYILGNEFYNFNHVATSGTSRGDIPFELTEGKKGLFGVLYDETEHLQIHYRYYQPENPYFHWANPNLASLEEAEEALEKAIRERVLYYPGLSVYTEHVFPIMIHIFARAGCTPCPKLMKEEFNSLTMAVAMGAAKQYGRNFGICCDLWGPDIGEWFLRFWGMPGHSPQEFEDSLKAAWLLRPEMIFVENIDALVRIKEKGWQLTPFGQAFRRFMDWKENVKLPYEFSDLTCKIAVIRSDDGIMSDKGTFQGKGCFGSDTFVPDEKNLSFQRVMFQLMHRTTSAHGLTMHNTPDYRMASNQYYPWKREEVMQFPLENGIPCSTAEEHRLIFPLKETLIFDEKVKKECLKDCELIIVCGSRITEQTVQEMIPLLEQGVKVIVAEWFRPYFEKVSNRTNITFVQDFLTDEVQRLLRPWLGSNSEWSVSFGKNTLKMREEKGHFFYEIC